MKVLIQRVKSASLKLNQASQEPLVKINEGLLVFLGVVREDAVEDLIFVVERIVNLRIFEDDLGKLNFSVKDRGFEVMAVPNFTLAASTAQGRRPSFDNAAGKDKGKEFFDIFCVKIREQGLNCSAGVFGASMLIEAKNYGPVNIILDSRNR